MGLPRSGSTLLELSISKSPGVVLFGETLLLSPWRRDFRYFLRTQIGDISKDENLRKMVDLVFSNHDEIPGISGTFWRWSEVRAIGEEELKERVVRALQSSDRSLGAIFRVLLKETTEFNNARRCCVSFPVHVQHLPELVKWFPEAKIIYITRDPRAIAMSKTNDPGGTAIYNRRFPYLRYVIRKAMIAFVVVQYISASRIHERFRKHPNYLLVKYEDFVLQPARIMQEICRFAGIEYRNDMLEQTGSRIQPSSISGKSRTKSDATAASVWKSVITPFERFVVTMLTKRSMARFGFDYRTHAVYSTITTN